eukprot:TRINITY_DN19582_c0_g1_i1.p1 TRINITY_DN19582_c0_g1~~TRINITY_DN19582_c0_g1_i1.p1  ORF type:complete len:276 (+),score=29.75 TRINITY_DN19582_c0_g1_i1:63-830(+)
MPAADGQLSGDVTTLGACAACSPHDRDEAKTDDIELAAEETLGLVRGISELATGGELPGAAEGGGSGDVELSIDNAGLKDVGPGMRWGAIRCLEMPVFGIVFIGPHWYCSIILLAFILGVGSWFVLQAGELLGRSHVIAGIGLTMLSVKSFLECALADPGILQPTPGKALTDEAAKALPEQFLPSTGRRFCKACSLVQPPGCYHCRWCRVCVDGWDHHCPWMNKCIGRKNLASFQCFLCVSFPALVYMVIALIVG